MYKRCEKGSVVTYILAAIFLSGLLVAVLSQGSKKSVDASHVEKEVSYLKADIESIHYSVSECLQVYPDRVDINGDGLKNTDDNPNHPFPLYAGDDQNADPNDDFSHGSGGQDFREIRCPAAPATGNKIFSENLYNSIKLLSNSALYDTIYFNDPVEGVYIRVSTTNPDVIWKESISRINDMFSACAIEVITDAGDCAGQCLYYWMSRPATSVLGDEADCP